MQDFEKEFRLYAENLLGSKLNARMRNLMAYLSRIYEFGKKSLDNYELVQFLEWKGPRNYRSYDLYPREKKPKSPHEFFSYLKGLLICLEHKYASDYQDFFELITILPEHKAFLELKEQQKWLEILEVVESRSLNPKIQFSLRIRLEKSSFTVEFTPTREEPFRRIGIAKLRDLWREQSYINNTGTHYILQACCDHYGNLKTNEWELNDENLHNLFAKLLREESSFSQYVATEEGQGMVIENTPLRWGVDYKSDSESLCDIKIHDADDQPIHDYLFHVMGENYYLITQQKAYKIKEWPDGIRIQKLPLSIPKSSLQTRAGVALFRQLNIPVPSPIREIITTLTPQTCVYCHIQSSPGNYETLIMQAHGGLRPGDEIYTWKGDTWYLDKAKLPRLDKIIEIDDRQLSATSTWLKNLDFKINSYGEKPKYEFRVKKNFPDEFIQWVEEKPQTTELLLDKELSNIINGEISGSVNLEIGESSSGIDWFDIQVNLTVSDSTLTKEDIALLLKAKGKWIKLKEKGWRKFDYTFSEETERELAEIGLNPHDLNGEKQKLHALQLGTLAKKKSSLLDFTASEQITRRVDEIQTRVTPELPKSICADLRPYQIEGFHFLAYLSTNHFGGVLADDMGLGKTLQALTWLAWLHQNQGIKLPSLVIAPKSVQENWDAETRKFYPTLRTRTWKSGDIDHQFNAADFDLLIINYAQLRNYSENLNATSWLAVIVDEAQNIKNPTSQSASCIRSLNANQRLALTGTPIENRLMDLWSIFSFAMPGALGTRAHFTKSFDNAKDPLARRRLSARTRPFLLRRTKNEVAKDLPDRIEEDLSVELEGQQHKLYQAELKRARAHLLNASIPGQLDKLRFNLLSSLLRLRQICCHPALIGLESDSDLVAVAPKTKKSPAAKKIATKSGDSCKLEALMELLEPLIEEGQKILVFSQFVSMLEIIQQELQNRTWKQFILTGKTDDRGALVNDFQSHEGAAVFLISLKAGGAGLNLTAASYVVLFDPWWNPAVEAQAIDRTHRIGQKSTVIAYRIVVKNTIEQKIRELQKHKSAVAQDILGEENFARALTISDFQFLLSDS